MDLRCENGKRGGKLWWTAESMQSYLIGTLIGNYLRTINVYKLCNDYIFTMLNG